ncbi:hypothetical protein [Streptomyces sp. IBSBF 3136]|uniref:hypothetical protein n=1 Tax=Streptomyces sp. IBSBF 3136 TaxID=2903524 RepID=UPI002FDC7935
MHRDLIVVPYDSHLSARRAVDLSRPRPRTANAFLDLAALVMTEPDAPDAPDERG